MKYRSWHRKSDGRVWLETWSGRFRLYGFQIDWGHEGKDKDTIRFLRFAFTPDWKAAIRSNEQCSKCHRWVGTACEVPSDPQRCMQAYGAWDGSCREFYYPEDYR